MAAVPVADFITKGRAGLRGVEASLLLLLLGVAVASVVVAIELLLLLLSKGAGSVEVAVDAVQLRGMVHWHVVPRRVVVVVVLLYGSTFLF